MEKGLLAYLKRYLKTRGRFTAISDLQDNEERVSVHSGNGKITSCLEKNHWLFLTR